ncbi:PHA/PHB synthase family protein [Mycobacterium sp.]|jgi:polyhydroxyalkanoate synthase|uniref:PHA/PHB synthase family protein n=1 Tax=Mycobacterium sp. TaxID=1785 RepID=UPI002BBD285B|nr:alpha/beta fold hydrolase [Mycobacterium sp.]HTH92849.1 alpha/beta fold hydrolase [Mycobacterium sp.]
MHDEDLEEVAWDADEVAAPLDLLLSGSTLGVARRLLPNASSSRLVINLAKQPRTVTSQTTGLVQELISVVRGSSEIAPAKGDKRFADAAWRANPFLKRTMQAYLAADKTVEGLFSAADLEWRDAERIRFALDFFTEALAPSNNPLLNPLGWKALIDTGGLSALRGVRHFLSDIASSPRVPAMVRQDAFTVGETVAATAGSVVFRAEEFELIQYAPRTEKVWSVPLLIVPPVVNKFYILDISPGRSMIEYLVDQGVQVFTISWRNPTAAQKDWGLDTFGRAVLNALEAVEKITETTRTHLLAACSGGMLAATSADHLAATGDLDRVASLGLMVTVLDQSKAGFMAAAVDEEVAKIATALSARKGYLDGRSLAEVFAWLRPADLVWRYWVNNYIEGKSPPPFDVLFWNADTTRMPAALHRDMVKMAIHNVLARPGAVSMLGTPVDLTRLTLDSYVVAGIDDHISPWQACYRSAQLLGSEHLRFVLSTSGHIASIINPPGNTKSTYRVGDSCETDPAQWVQSAEKHSGSWWPDYVAWLNERSGEQKTAPQSLGGAGMAPLAPAPGRYVLDR